MTPNENEPLPPTYTLSPTDDNGYANPQWTAIDLLDPTIDKGWVIIRHHKSEELLDSYLDGLDDGRRNWTSDEEHDHKVFRNKYGLYSLHRRPATPGCRDHLLIYYAKVVDAVDGHRNVCRVFDSDGNEQDEDVILPDDVPNPLADLEDLRKQ